MTMGQNKKGEQEWTTLRIKRGGKEWISLKPVQEHRTGQRPEPGK